MMQIGAPDEDDWETDPDYVNEQSEEERRYGGRRNCEAVDMDEIRANVISAEAEASKAKASLINGSMGYGGKFGVEKDRMDASAMGHDYEGKVEKHGSQKDYAKGFGGKHGVMKDRQDRSALGWDHIETLEKHDSQKDYKVGFGGEFGIQKDRVDKSAADWSHVDHLNKHQSQTDYKGGFGGKFGVQSDRVDKSAVGWEHVEQVEKHQSQKDYKTGFGGQFGVQSDRVDKSAVGWEHMENLNKHESQTDYAKGFGGKYGIQADRVDKNAHSFEDTPGVVGTNYIKDKPDIPTRKAKNLREMFEKGGNADSQREEEFKRQKEKRKEQEAREVQAENRRIQERKKNNVNDDEEDSNKGDIAATKEAISVATKGQALNFKQRFESNPVSQSNGSSSFAEERRKELEQIKQMKSESQNSSSSASSAIQDVKNKLEDTAQFGIVLNNAPKRVESVSTSNESKSTYQEPVKTPKEEVAPIPIPVVSDTRTEQQPVSDDSHKAEIATVQTDNGENGGPSLSAIARYDYQAGADDEISFLPDDIIINIEKVDEGWWLGECGGKYGLFPANYVEVI